MLLGTVTALRWFFRHHAPLCSGEGRDSMKAPPPHLFLLWSHPEEHHPLAQTHPHLPTPPTPPNLSLPSPWPPRRLSEKLLWSSAAFMRGNGAWLGSFSCSWGLWGVFGRESERGRAWSHSLLSTVSSRPSKDRFISFQRDCRTFYSFSLPSVFAKTV